MLIAGGFSAVSLTLFFSRAVSLTKQALSALFALHNTVILGSAPDGIRATPPCPPASTFIPLDYI